MPILCQYELMMVNYLRRNKKNTPLQDGRGVGEVKIVKYKGLSPMIKHGFRHSRQMRGHLILRCVCQVYELFAAIHPLCRH